MNLPRILIVLLFATHTTKALEVTSHLGQWGEVSHWLVLRTAEMPMEADPFASIGGEAKFAAMGEARLLPQGDQPLTVPGATPGEWVRIGEAVWEGMQMVLPTMPGVWNELPRLVVPEGATYAYCRLDSPRDMKAHLATGVNRGKHRLYLNGAGLGTFDREFAFELAREVPVELKKGPNHLLVRFSQGAQFACRLVGENAEPLREVKVTLQVPNARFVKPSPPAPMPEKDKLQARVLEIPPLAPPEHPEWHGVNLARTLSLLESGKYTHRPVRILFDGQSIESGWPELLIQRLRERYPETTIIAENRAIGGWFVWRMQKLLKHDILRAQPDLVLFSAYQGTAEVWERFLSELRSETTADIVIRTQHIDGNEAPDQPLDGAETVLLRRLARKYGVELVEVRREWLDYLQRNGFKNTDLLRDKVHLNRRGETLMALLYERHFPMTIPVSQGWACQTRRFDVGRFLADHKADEIVLEGDGWTHHETRIAKSNASSDRLRLKFRGTRADLVLPISHGRATVLIDGKKPSEWNLFHGTRPQPRVASNTAPNMPMTYHLGPNTQEETWVLTMLEGNADADERKANRRVRFRLVGSKTGVDGEGQSDRKFVSNSGRITILPTDWHNAVEPLKEGEAQPVMQAYTKRPQVVWHILPDGRDEVPHGPGWWGPQTDHYSGQPYDYVTVADGLPCGIHELTVIPVPDPNVQRAFSVVGVDIHLPPLARDAAESTQPGGSTTPVKQ